MRIIAGEHRGRRLLPPIGDQTRPVTDRAKQSIFDVVAPLINGARVYDCFAGTGSFGLESLSRGAAHATFFEAHRPTMFRLKENIAALRCDSRSTLVATDWFAAICGPQPAKRADVIFLDPPYRYLRDRPADLQHAAFGMIRHLDERGVVIFRHDGADALGLPGFNVEQVRMYGGMMVEWLRPAICPPVGAGNA